MANIINTVRTFTIADTRVSFNPHATKNGKARLTVGVKENDGSFYRAAIFGDAAEDLKNRMEAAGSIYGGILTLTDPSEVVSSDGQTKFLNTALRCGFRAVAQPEVKAEVEAPKVEAKTRNTRAHK